MSNHTKVLSCHVDSAAPREYFLISTENHSATENIFESVDIKEIDPALGPYESGSWGTPEDFLILHRPGFKPSYIHTWTGNDILRRRSSRQ